MWFFFARKVKIGPMLDAPPPATKSWHALYIQLKFPNTYIHNGLDEQVLAMNRFGRTSCPPKNLSKSQTKTRIHSFANIGYYKQLFQIKQQNVVDSGKISVTIWNCGEN